MLLLEAKLLPSSDGNFCDLFNSSNFNVRCIFSVKVLFACTCVIVVAYMIAVQLLNIFVNTRLSDSQSDLLQRNITGIIPGNWTIGSSWNHTQ